MTAPNHPARPALSETQILARIDNLVRGLEVDPLRVAEVQRHYEAVVTALNGSSDARGEQDALCVFEAVALLLGQLTAGLPDRDAHGLVQYVQVRSLQHRDVFTSAGKAARHYVDGRAALAAEGAGR